MKGKKQPWLLLFEQILCAVENLMLSDKKGFLRSKLRGKTTKKIYKAIRAWEAGSFQKHLPS
jgi:hypothetical protein